MDPRATVARLRALGIERGSGRGFVFEETAPDVAYDFHTHRRHQLLYAVQGAARLEVEHAVMTLPPQRAAWIPAGTRHATHVNGASLVSVYFERALAPVLPEVRVFDVPPLLREMLLYARRWPLGHAARERRAGVYFRALLGVVFDLMQHRPVYALPRPRSETTARALTWVLDHLAQATLARAARASGTTARTLRRRLVAETGLGFRDFVGQARVQRAIELLAGDARSLLEIALEVGFQSQSAFTQAFRRTTGQTPRAFRLAAAQAAQPALSRPRSPRDAA